MPNQLLNIVDTLNPNKKALIDANVTVGQAVAAALKEKCTKDLFLFNRHVLEAEEGDEKFVKLAPFQKEMCHFVTDERKKKKLLLIPRNHLKTKLITVGYSLFRIAEDPKVRILIYSATWQVAVDILSQIQRNLAGCERFIDLFGNLSQNPKEWSADRIRLTVSDKREPTVTAAGIDNNLVGQHYDLIIFDDVVNEDNIGTSEQIQKVIKRYNNSLDLLEPNGQIIVIGTRWHDSDLYGWLLDSSNEVSRQYDTTVQEAYKGDLATGSDFSLLWPDKFTREELLKRQHSQGWSHFSAQYLNNPVPEEDATFKRTWFQYYEPEDLKGKLLTKFIAIDPAISEAKYADYTAMVVVGVDQWGFINILDITRSRLNPNAIIEEIFRLVNRWQLKSVAIETVAYQKTLAYTLREQSRLRNIYFHVEELQPNNRSKDERIKGLQPLYENGKMIHNSHLPNNYFLEDELTRYPRGKHDDVIDALSYLLDKIGRASCRERV